MVYLRPYFRKSFTPQLITNFSLNGWSWPKDKNNYNEKENTMNQDPAYCKLEEKTTVAGKKKSNGSYTFVIMWTEGPAALEERLFHCDHHGQGDGIVLHHHPANGQPSVSTEPPFLFLGPPPPRGVVVVVVGHKATVNVVPSTDELFSFCAELLITATWSQTFASFTISAMIHY